MNATATAPRRFDVALSFPGETRPFVSKVDEYLSQALGATRVFYDQRFEAELARPNLDTHLQNIYHNDCEVVAVFLCEDYERKEWCGLEWRAVRDLIKAKQDTAIMLFRFDDTPIAGLFSIDGYVAIGSRGPEDVAQLILRRVHSRGRRDTIKRSPASSNSSGGWSPYLPLVCLVGGVIGFVLTLVSFDVSVAVLFLYGVVAGPFLRRSKRDSFDDIAGRASLGALCLVGLPVLIHVTLWVASGLGHKEVARFGHGSAGFTLKMPDDWLLLALLVGVGFALCTTIMVLSSYCGYAVARIVLAFRDAAARRE